MPRPGIWSPELSSLGFAGQRDTPATASDPAGGRLFLPRGSDSAEAIRHVSAILATMAEAVRTPIRPEARLPTRRTLDERFFVCWPGAYAAFARALTLLPPRS